MIQFFRQNNFFTTLMLIPYTFIVRVACFYLFEPPVAMETGGVLYNVFYTAFSDKILLSHIVINFIIAFTAILVNRIVIKHRLSRYQTLLPGLVYILLVSWLESFLAFTAIHIANFFVMIGFLSMYKFSRKMESPIVVFDGCFYIALAALFYTPYVIYLVPAFMGYISLDSFKLRDFANAIVGFVLPFFIVSGFIYFFKGDYFIFDGYEINRNILTWFTELNWIDIIPLAFYGSIIAICVISYNYMVRKKNLLIQKKVNIFFWFLMFSFFTIFLINEKNSANLLILAIPTSMLIGMVLEWVKTPFVEEFVHVVILGGIFYLHFNQSVNILM